MATGNANNVTTGAGSVNGYVFAAPIGTPLPTSTSESLNAAFKDLGFVSEDGFEIGNTFNGGVEVKEWHGNTVYNHPGSKSETAHFKLIEALNIEVLKVIYGPNNVTVTNGEIHVASDADGAVPMSYVVDIEQRSGRLRRIVLPVATITSLGNIVFKNNEAVGYDATFGLSLGANGTTHDEYISAAPAST